MRSYDIAGPFASLRLKHWRRGLQDVDYLTMAAAIDPVHTAEIVNAIIPKAAWEVGVTVPEDPTWVISDIGWSTDPDVWEKTRSDVAGYHSLRFHFYGLSQRHWPTVSLTWAPAH